jgi:alanine racemase
MHRPLRLICSADALRSNWQWLAKRAGAPCGAAVKADGYGLGASSVVEQLAYAGCRDFFVSSWWEADQLGPQGPGVSVSVLHGLGPNDLAACASSSAKPVLNSAAQVQRWKSFASDQICDVMIDTGMNRLGLRMEEAGVLDGLAIDTLHSHLACADENHPLNTTQLGRFRDACDQITARRYSLANSAGICLGQEYSFGLVRPGLALYGGIPRDEARGHIQPVAALEAQVVQRRTVHAGESCGYGGTFVAQADTPVAILNLGYADGYWRAFSSVGQARSGDAVLPVIGRVSMDLVAVDCASAPELGEGDWAALDFDLEQAAAQAGKSQYELLTGLAHRFERVWR